MLKLLFFDKLLHTLTHLLTKKFIKRWKIRTAYFFQQQYWVISFIIGVVFFTNAWKSSQSANQTISVTGSAKKEIVSDLGFLRGTISVQSSTSESAFAELNRQKPILISYLERKGFPKDKIEFNTINSYPVYEMSEQGYQTGRVIGYVYSQRIEIQSLDVNKIKELSLDITSLN